MKLSTMVQSFVLHFGEMGSRWGINRTVGQIYALLVMTKTPINADDISEALSISRSNVSMGMKELQSWQLVKLQHIPGDRKEYFSAPGDVWDIARTLIEQRRRREIDPTLTVLRDVLMEQPADEADEYAQERMRDMHELIELITQWSIDIQRLSASDLKKLLKLGSGVTKVLDIRDTLIGKKGNSKKDTSKKDSTKG
jgi:DNA-binding transcriptional regulator GbsR (MarR family)